MVKVNPTKESNTLSVKAIQSGKRMTKGKAEALKRKFYTGALHTIINAHHGEVPLSQLAITVQCAKKDGVPLDMKELNHNIESGLTGSTLLNSLLYQCKVLGKEDCKEDYEKHAKNFMYILDSVDEDDVNGHLQYTVSEYDSSDCFWHSPLYWITWHDESYQEHYPITMALLPYLRKRNYFLTAIERRIIPDAVLQEWDKMESGEKADARR